MLRNRSYDKSLSFDFSLFFLSLLRARSCSALLVSRESLPLSNSLSLRYSLYHLLFSVSLSLSLSLSFLISIWSILFLFSFSLSFFSFSSFLPRSTSDTHTATAQTLCNDHSDRTINAGVGGAPPLDLPRLCIISYSQLCSSKTEQSRRHNCPNCIINL